jgi:hypothetical protein
MYKYHLLITFINNKKYLCWYISVTLQLHTDKSVKDMCIIGRAHEVLFTGAMTHMYNMKTAVIKINNIKK